MNTRTLITWAFLLIIFLAIIRIGMFTASDAREEGDLEAASGAVVQPLAVDDSSPDVLELAWLIPDLAFGFEGATPVITKENILTREI
ncbi:MAG: hypothetical protein ABIC95_05575 [archaeon]